MLNRNLLQFVKIGNVFYYFFFNSVSRWDGKESLMIQTTVIYGISNELQFCSVKLVKQNIALPNTMIKIDDTMLNFPEICFVLFQLHNW